MGCIGIIGSILGFFRNNGKENGKYYYIWDIWGCYRNNGEQKGNYYLGFRVKGF